MSDSKRPDPKKKKDSQPQPDEQGKLPFFGTDSDDAAVPADEPIAFDSQDGVDIPDEWMKSGEALLVDSQADDFEPLASSESVYEYESQYGVDSPNLMESVAGLLADEEPIAKPVAKPARDADDDDDDAALAFLTEDDDDEQPQAIADDDEDVETATAAAARPGGNHEDDEDDVAMSFLDDDDEQPQALAEDDDEVPISLEQEELDDEAIAIADDEEVAIALEDDVETGAAVAVVDDDEVPVGDAAISLEEPADEAPVAIEDDDEVGEPVAVADDDDVDDEETGKAVAIAEDDDEVAIALDEPEDEAPIAIDDEDAASEPVAVADDEDELGEDAVALDEPDDDEIAAMLDEPSDEETVASDDFEVAGAAAVSVSDEDEELAEIASAEELGLDSGDHIDIPDEWLASGDGSLVGEAEVEADAEEEMEIEAEAEALEELSPAAMAPIAKTPSAPVVPMGQKPGQSPPAPTAKPTSMASSDEIYVYSSNAGTDSQAPAMPNADMMSDDGAKLLFGSEVEMNSDDDFVLDSAAPAVGDSHASDEGTMSDSQFIADSGVEGRDTGVEISEADAVVDVDKTMQSDEYEELAVASDAGDSERASDADYVSGSQPGAHDLDKTMQSDDDYFNQFLGSDSATISDAGSASGVDEVLAEADIDVDKTMQSDYDDLVASDSATMSDSGSVSGVGSSVGSDADEVDYDKTMQSDDFAEMASGSGSVSGSADSEVLSESSGGDDYDKTMLSDYGAAEQEEFGKTIAIHDFDDGTPRGWLSGREDEFDKTMAAEEFGVPVPAGGDAFGATMLSDSGEIGAEGSSAAGWDEARTMMDSGDGPGMDESGKTMVLDGEAPRRPPPAAVTQDLGVRAGGGPGPTRWEGSQTSGMATSAPGAAVGAGREALSVAERSVSGMSYGEDKVGDYRLVKQLGEGGMGVVYVAKQSSLARDVVFKTLKPMAADQQAKLKSEGRYKSVIDHRTKMFLSEAVVTADLFHPNIVPIYELGEAPDGSLFYAMKWVRGEPWHKKFKDMTLEDNLDVLMKVADAVAFAHARQIVNRDLKPENVMLGEFGEVIVLDWGLALPFGEAEKRLPLSLTAGLGSGTPAYMPPELITGPLNKIGPPADVYLLGAMLFELVTGVPPHEFNMPAQSSARQKMAEVRRIVSENVIRPADTLLTKYEVKHRAVMENEIRLTEHRGELIDIAMRAMATKPEDRYPSVQEFQKAIREYEKHSTSRILSARATEMAAEPAETDEDAEKLHGYTRYQNSLALYQESLREWSGNEEARDGLTQTQVNLAELALENGDYDLGLSVLDPDQESHLDTHAKLVAAKKKREARAKQMKMLAIAAASALVMFAITAAVAAKFQFNLKAAVEMAKNAETKAEEAEQKATDAETKTKEAEAKTVVAEEKTMKAEMAFVAANEAKVEAEQKQAEAVESQKIAEKNLMKAETDLKVADTKLKDASEKLKEADTKLVKANDDLKVAEEKTLQAEEKVKVADTKLVAANKELDKAQEKLDVAQERVADSSYRAGLADADRHVREGKYPDARKKLKDLKERFAERCKLEWDVLWATVEEGQTVSLTRPVESLSMSRDGRVLAAVENDGTVVVWPVDDQGLIAEDKPQRLNHGARPRTVEVSASGQLLAVAGDTGAVQIWSLKINRAIAELRGHSGGVNAVQFSADESRIVSGGDDRTLRIWDIATEKELGTVKCLYPVQSLDWSADGKTLVAGTGTADEVTGLAYAWSVTPNADAVQLREIRRFQAPPSGLVKQNRSVVAIAMSADGQHVVCNGPGSELYLWRVRKSNGEPLITLKVTDFAIRIGNHSKRVERVRSVAFAADGSRLVAGGDDGTISVWERATADSVGALPRYDRGLILYGHSGPVRSCRLLPQVADRVVSASYDQNVWVWNLKTYPESRKWLDQPASAEDTKAAGLQSSVVPSITIRPMLVSNVSTKPANAVGKVGVGSGSVDRQKSPLTANEMLINGAVQQPVSSRPAFFFGSEQQSTHSRTRESLGNALDVERSRDAGLPRVRRRSDSERLALIRDLGPSPLGLIGPQVTRNNALPNAEPIAWADLAAQDKRAGAKAPVRIVTGHTDSVLSAAFRRDGSRVLTSSRDQTARVWDTQTGKPIRTSDGSIPFADNVLAEGHEYDVFSTLFFPNGERLLTSSFDGTMRIWDARVAPQLYAGRELVTLPGTGMFGVVDISRDGAWIVTAGRGNSAQLWKLDDVLTQRRPQPNRVFDGQHRLRVTAVTMSPDSKIVLTADREGNVMLWSAEDGKLIGRKRAAHTGELTKAIFLADGKQLLTAAVDRRVTLWDVIRGNDEITLQPVRKFEHDGMVTNLSLSPAGDRFLSVARKGEKAARAKKADAAKGDGDKAAAPVSLTTLTLWTLPAGESRVIELPPLAPNESAEAVTRGTVTPAWNSDGKQAIVTTADGMLHLLDANAGRFTQTLAIHEVGSGSARLRAVSAVFPPNESPVQHVVTQSQSGVTLWRLADGSKLTTFRPQGILFSASYSSDGKLVATGGQSLRLFDADEASPRFGRSLHKIDSPHGGIVTSVEFSPVADSQRFLTTSWDGSAKVWEWQPAEQIARLRHVLNGHEGPVRFGTWSPDGRRILTVGHDAHPRVWTFADEAAAPAPAELPLETDRDFDQLCGAFSWDGQFVAVGGRDVATQESLGWIWRLPTEAGQPATLHATVRGHGLGGINAIVFHPLDDRLLTAGTDGTARLWDWQKNLKPSDEPLEAVFLLSLTQPGESTTHRGPVTSLRITPDGKIATASADGTALIWLISRPATAAQ